MKTSDLEEKIKEYHDKMNAAQTQINNLFLECRDAQEEYADLQENYKKRTGTYYYWRDSDER